jgi:hypothetical protein
MISAGEGTVYSCLPPFHNCVYCGNSIPHRATDVSAVGHSYRVDVAVLSTFRTSMSSPLPEQAEWVLTYTYVAFDTEAEFRLS